MIPKLIGSGIVLVLFLALFIRLTVFSADKVTRMKWRSQFRMKPGEGFASHWDILFQHSRWAMIVKARHGRPDMGHRQRVFSPARHYAVRLGRANAGRKVFSSYENMLGIIAPPRTSKTRYLTDLVYGHPGAVLSTSTRPDVYRRTVAKRTRLGPVYVFNPEDLGGIESTFRIDIVSICIDPDLASKTAAAMVGPTDGFGENKFWADKAKQALGGLLHAAALYGYDISAVVRWGNRQGDFEVKNAFKIPGANLETLGHAMSLQEDSKGASSVRMFLAEALAWAAIPSLRHMVSGNGLITFDAERWAEDKGTIYMINSGEDSVAAPLFRVIVDRVFRECVHAGSMYPSGKLPVPVGFYLDELTQICSVAINKWLAFAGGSGIFICYVTHTPSQLVEVYGEASARTIWQLTGVKLLLWGSSDGELMEEVSKVLGETSEEKPVRKVPVEFIRRLPRGRGLVVSANHRPVVVKVRPLQHRLSHRLGMAPKLPVALPIPEQLVLVSEVLVPESEPVQEAIVVDLPERGEQEDGEQAA
jgi:type IV secretory pathway TraG/TraD family ATPase VirD4